jgi:hypothetical protein
VRRDLHGQVAEQRIIGIEVRVRDAGGLLEEVALVPCDIRLPLSGPWQRGRLNLTIHTSFGDINPRDEPELRA